MVALGRCPSLGALSSNREAEHAVHAERAAGGADGGRPYQMSKSAAEILANVDLFAEDQREHLLDALAIARKERPILL